MDESNMSRDEFKDAKKAYKQARRAAGKSRKSLVIGIAIAVVVVAALAAGATWFLMSQQQEQTAPAEEVKVEQQTEPQEESPYSAYLGIWNGELISAESASYNGPRCYGAEGGEAQLDIRSISQSGRMKISGKILFHGHEKDLASDADTVTGDTEIEFTDVTATFHSQSFELSVPVGTDNKNKVKIEVSFPQAGTQPPTLKAESYFNGSLVQTDTFTLEKQQ